MAQYTILHNSHAAYGRSGLRLLPYLEPLIKDQGAEKLLDFGCGKAALSRSLQLQGYNVSLYDPYIPKFASWPEGIFDLTLCTDVMEHIPKEEIPKTLASIRKSSKNAIFVISLTFADTLLPDGSNAHCTIETSDWWRSKLKEVFPEVAEVPTRQSTAVCFTTWRPKENSLATIRRIKTSEARKKRIKDITRSPMRKIFAARLRKKELTGLNKLTHGKSVAVVGNAISIRSKTHGRLIDEHDVVVRLNRGPILSYETSGSKTDIFATSVWISSGLFHGRNASLFLWLTPKTKNFPEWVKKDGSKAEALPKHIHKYLCSYIGARPSSGLMAIEAVMRCNPEKLSIFGFDWFSSCSLSGSHTAATSPHDFKAELRYIKSLSNSRILSFF